MSDRAEPADSRSYLSGLELHGVKLGLSTIRGLCAALAHPERDFASVLVAGTNGKGSVAAMAAAALGAAGHRTARYTSPHLVHLEERFEIGGHPVSPDDLDSAVAAVRRAVERLQRDGVVDVQPTFFEVTTAAAFELFRRAGVEIAVLEVGLGGRFDATNIVDPAAVAITSVAMDHEQYLGHTLGAIAFEKAGVLRRGVPAIVGPVPAEARAVIADVGRERRSLVIDAEDGCTIETSMDNGRTTLKLSTPTSSYGPLVLSLRGRHQVTNAVVAVRLLEVLEGAGVTVPASAIEHGLALARWPARLDLQVLPDGRQALVDGAHNPAGAEALARYIQEQWPRGLPLVFGAMRDKRLVEMIGAVAPVARPMILTEAPGRRAASALDLAAAAHVARVGPVTQEAEIEAALRRAWAAGPVIAVAGSLYLAGRVLALLGRM